MANPSGRSAHRCQHERRETRRDRALARKAERESRTDSFQMTLLASRPGRSTREMTRLSGKVEA